MRYKKGHKTHDEIMKELAAKYKIAESKRDERKIKFAIIKLYVPFCFKIKFNKIIVLLSIATIISYTVAAILLQKYTQTEISPTLTTCVYAFFGTELIGLAGIKIYDTKYISHENNTNYSDIISKHIEDDDAVG